MYNIFLYCSTVVIWGTVWIGITFQLGAADPLTSVLYRIALAALVLVLYCVFRRKKMLFSLTDHIWMAAQGFALFSINYWLFYLGTEHLESGLVSVVFSSIVLMNMANGALFLGYQMSVRKILGAVIGITGVFLLFYEDIVSFNPNNERLKAILICLLATYLVSLGNIISARNQLTGIPVTQSNAYGMIYGTIFVFLISLVNGNSFAIEPTAKYLLSLVYLSLVCTVLAFSYYLTLVGRIGADKAAYATLLFPIIALLLSTLFEGYRWNDEAYLGIALALIGNWLIIEKGRSPLALSISSLFKTTYIAQVTGRVRGIFKK